MQTCRISEATRVPLAKITTIPPQQLQGTNPTDMDAMLAVPLWGARFIEDVDVVTPLMGATKLEAPSNAAPPRTAPEDTAHDG